MSLTLRAATASDPGLVRTNNEDSVHAGPRLLVVADGVGGMPAGELASDIVVRELAALERVSRGGEPLSALRNAVDAASRRIRAAAESDPATDGMGTTVTALLLSGDQLALLHVGDSRAYLLRDGTLRQVTRDDTYVQSLVDQGMLTPEDARGHPQRSVITKAVQGQHVAPTCSMLTPQAGDRLLLCSDGLSDVVADSALSQGLTSYPDRRQCAEQLIKMALQAGAPDNVTVIVADVTTGEKAGHAGPTTDEEPATPA